MIIMYSSHNQAYTVLQYHHHPDEDNTLSIHITILDEALSIMLLSSKFYPIQEELQLLRSTIDRFLNHLKHRFETNADIKPDIDWTKIKIPENQLKEGFSNDDGLTDRRKVLTSLLYNENRSWKNVYTSLG